MKKALLISFLFLLFQAVTGAVVMACTNVADGDLSTYRYWLIGTSLVICNILTACTVGFILKGRIAAALHWPVAYRPKTATVTLTLATLVCLIFVVNALLEIFNVDDLLEADMEGMISNALCLASITVIAPVCEEICFRRGVMDALKAKGYSMHWCITISAVIFGVIHMNPAQIIGAGLLGLFLAWLYARTESLLLPIVCHVINNTLSVVLSLCFGIGASLQDHMSVGIIYAVTTILFVAGAALFFALRKQFDK